MHARVDDCVRARDIDVLACDDDDDDELLLHAADIALEDVCA